MVMNCVIFGIVERTRIQGIAAVSLEFIEQEVDGLFLFLDLQSLHIAHPLNADALLSQQ